MAAPRDFLTYLLAQGLVNYEVGIGSGTWGGALYVMPPKPDQVVVVGEYPGLPPETKTGREMLGLQVRIRGLQAEITVTSDKITAIARALDGQSPVRAGGTQYLAVLSQSSGPLFLGLDEQGHRPEFSWNFIVWRSR